MLFRKRASCALPMIGWICLIFLTMIQKNQIRAASLLRAPSVFRSDEVDLHKYSAVLAATEPFRLQCHQQLQRTLNPFRRFTGKLFGKTLFDQGLLVRNLNSAVDNALTKFEQRVQNTLRSYGMTTEEFNSLSSQLNQQKSLKKRVLLQAYLYKIAADLELNLRKALPTLPSISKEKNVVVKPPTNPLPTLQSSASDKDQSQDSDLTSSAAQHPYYTVDDTASLRKRFARTLREIEHERLRIRNSLKRALKIRELPPKIADPEYLPAMAPIIQKSCKEFPTIATDIIHHYGLHIEEFNVLQEKLQRNFIFRYQVMKDIDELDKASQRNNLNHHYT